MSLLKTELKHQIQRRRTFAIISHPDAGKTTLTEKLLLYGGAIHLAGAVKAKGHQKQTTSDWLEIEKQRGISVSSSVLQFEYQGYQLNLLDTPGHRDFSEDTYRTLSAVDAAIMLIDAGKGVEPQTRKLFEVCRMRNLPIFTWMNKLDRPSRHPFELIHELETILNIQSYPLTWPIGTGDQFLGVYDREQRSVLFFHKEEEANVRKRLATQQIQIHEPNWLKHLLHPLKTHHSEEAIVALQDQFNEELALLDCAGESFDVQRVLSGELTPIFFGSAMNNFGIEKFLNSLIQIAPPPAPRKTHEALIPPDSEAFSGFIFKIQANMDPAHRDRVAFLRVCSGQFTRHMWVQHVRLKQKIKLSQSVHFFAQTRTTVETAWPGDIVGLLDPSGYFKIGDTLCEGPTLQYLDIPKFAPEHFAQIQIADPMKKKQLKKGLDQLSEEGIIQIYYEQQNQQNPILGAVGVLQFEVLIHRLQTEYHVPATIQSLPFVQARWVTGPELDSFRNREDSRLVQDTFNNPVVLFQSHWSLQWAENHFKKITFSKTAPS